MCRCVIIVIMKIALTKGMFAIVDESDYEFINQFKWLLCQTYAARYSYEKGNRKWIFMHKLIVNAPEGMEVDHINHDRLDNRRSNLRVATHQQNSFNHPGYGHRGVTKVINRPLKKPYCVRLMISGKNLYLGYYGTMKEARSAWKQAALKYYGKFA